MATTADRALAQLRGELHRELTGHILPYWMTRAVDHVHGGFVGSVVDGIADHNAPKSAILNARILWTFSAASRALGAPEYAIMAQRCATYFSASFIDPTAGGVLWMVDAAGRPIDERKHVYAQAFAIYALAEHHRATGDPMSLEDAIGIFRHIDAQARDPRGTGYHEAFARDWTPLADVRLSERDLDAPRSANTHLHLLEAYATLYRAWPKPLLRSRLVELIELFVDRIAAPGQRHTTGFFDETWNALSTTVSFGHDIETSWLLEDAALAVGDDALLQRAQDTATRLAEAVLADGVDPVYGGVYNGRGSHGRVDTDKEWWPQAEAIVGFARAYERTGNERFLNANAAVWRFVRDYVVDRNDGEWRRRVSREGVPDMREETIGPWKCPYHNGRACLELLAEVRAAHAES